MLNLRYLILECSAVPLPRVAAEYCITSAFENEVHRSERSCKFMITRDGGKLSILLAN